MNNKMINTKVKIDKGLKTKMLTLIRKIMTKIAIIKIIS